MPTAWVGCPLAKAGFAGLDPKSSGSITSLVLGFPPPRDKKGSLLGVEDHPHCPVSDFMTGNGMERRRIVKSRYRNPDVLTLGLITPPLEPPGKILLTCSHH